MKHVVRSFMPATLVCVGLVCAAAAANGQSLESSIALGAPTVPESTMSGHCLKKVSPTVQAGQVPAPTEVILRVAVSRTGEVSPLSMVSGSALLEDSAFDAVRLWRYSPYVHDGRAMAVVTEVHVDFNPGRAGGMVSHPKS